MQNYQCLDDKEFTDLLDHSCEWYYQRPELCGYYDSKGPKCEQMFGEDADECLGKFQANKACCACKGSDVPS